MLAIHLFIFTPIAKTSKKSGTQSLPVYFDVNKNGKTPIFLYQILRLRQFLVGRFPETWFQK